MRWPTAMPPSEPPVIESSNDVSSSTRTSCPATVTVPVVASTDCTEPSRRVPLLDADRPRLAAVVHLRLEPDHLTDAQLGSRAGAVVDAHVGAGRVVAHAVDDHAAEAR